MSNWALELQGFDIIRIWIRGEANILRDAPSRAPWEDALAKHMPIPDMPFWELVKKMYQDPDGLELLVTKRKIELLGEEGRWTPLEGDDPRGTGLDWEEPEREPPPEAPYLDGVRKDGFNTPKFGRSEAAGMTYELGSYEVLWQPEDY